MAFFFTYLTLLALLTVDCVLPNKSKETICFPEKISFTEISLLNTDDVFRVSIDFSQGRMLAVGKSDTFFEDFNTRTVYRSSRDGICQSFQSKGAFIWQRCFDPAAPVKTEHRYIGPRQAMKLTQYTIKEDKPHNLTMFTFAYTKPYGVVPVLRKDVTDKEMSIFLFVDHSLDIPDREHFQVPTSCQT